jgi:superfamily II DNA or RNA helicase
MRLTGRSLQTVSNKLYISKVNEVYLHIRCESSDAMELNEYFTFYVPGYKFMPAFRNKIWDGKIRLFNYQTRQIYAGLLPHIQRFAEEREYEVELDESVESADEFSLNDAMEFIDTLGIPFAPRDYQVKAFVHSVRNRRAMLLSPTASGKSLIIYLLVRWFNCKTLVIVPTISLVAQLYKDFEDYGFDSNSNVHQIMAGADKQTNLPIVISTWQSIYKMPKEWFSQFDLVIGDEAHLFKAQSLTKILTNLTECKYRFGLTGTLDGTQTHKLVLEGLFGRVKQITTTKELIDSGRLAKFKIKALILKHDEDSCKACKNFKYQEEINYIVGKPSRNKFIRNLAISLKGNTLLLYQFVDKHGRILYNMIRDNVDDERPVFFIHGDVGVDEREEVRRITEQESNAIIVASYGTFSTGINIRNLHNIIFASPSKSKIRTLQSIGRGLRLGDNKEVATLFDISDDITYKSRKNFTLDHFMERMKIYNDEKFEYKIYTINLKEE